MAYDRHQVWRNVSSIFAELEKKAPEGRVPVCEVYLAEREAPVITVVVETSRDPEFRWVKLYTGDAEQHYVWVDEGLISRVEITFQPAGKFQAGFRDVSAE